MKFNIFLILICLILIIFIIVKISSIKENYENSLLEHESLYPMRINEVKNLRDIKLFDNELRLKCINSNKPRNIFVGDKTKPQNNHLSTLTTNDTIFIKDKIKLSKSYQGTNDPSPRDLNIDTLKTMKYLPYNFDNNICVGNECFTKHQLKMLKGRTPFYIKTFLNVKPFDTYSQPNFTYSEGGTVYRRTYGTDAQSYIDFPNPNRQGSRGGKSIKVTDSNYKVRLFELSNYQGASVEVGFGEHANIGLPNGQFRSMRALSASTREPIRNMCLSKFVRYKSIPRGGAYESYGPVPCDDSDRPDEDQFFFIKREDLLEEHTHDDDPNNIHMHDHGGNVRIHDGNLV